VGFAFGAQTLVKAREDWIVTGGRKRGHVKAAAQSRSPSGDGAFTTERTAVVIKRRQARERSGLPAIELAELRHLREQERCRTCTDVGHAVSGEARTLPKAWSCSLISKMSLYPRLKIVAIYFPKNIVIALDAF